MGTPRATIGTIWARTRATATPLLVFGLLVGACAESEDSDRVSQRYDALAETIEEERVALGASGAAVAVIEKGEVAFARGFGTKSANGTTTVEPTTLFRTGSTGKMLTALCVLKSVEAGELTLADPVTRHVPAFLLNRSPQAVVGIRVRHLLSHTSGLADYGETAAPPNERTEAALKGFFTGRYANIGYCASPPGALYAYSNPGFGLAGLVAQEAAGTPFRVLMRQRVFEPLGMNRTYFLATEVLNDGDYAMGASCTSADPQCEEPELGPVVGPESYDNPWSWPAGFEWSSVLDMARLGQFLVRGDEQVLREDLRDTMLSWHVSSRQLGDVMGYGLGVALSQGFGLPGSSANDTRWYDVPTIGHDGDIAGFASTFMCIPDRQFCFVALANASRAQLNRSLVVALKTLLDLPAPAALPDIAPRPERNPLYAGTYVDQFEVGEIRVTTDGSRLFIDIPALEEEAIPYDRELKPVSVDNFNLTTADETRQLTFLADTDGVYRHLRSRPYLAVRVSP